HEDNLPAHRAAARVHASRRAYTRAENPDGSRAGSRHGRIPQKPPRGDRGSHPPRRLRSRRKSGSAVVHSGAQLPPEKEKIAVAMKAKGYSDSVIAKVCGGNFDRALKEIWV